MTELVSIVEFEAIVVPDLQKSPFREEGRIDAVRSQLNPKIKTFGEEVW
jgi:hypothetical protein